MNVEERKHQRIMYDGGDLAEVLARAAARAFPFNAAPSFSGPAIADALARSRTRANLLTDVGRPFWKLWRRDNLSVMSQPLPTGDVWNGFLVVIVSSSSDLGRMVANLNRALQLAGSDAEQLVTSMEHRSFERGKYHHVIGCVPGSR